MVETAGLSAADEMMLRQTIGDYAYENMTPVDRQAALGFFMSGGPDIFGMPDLGIGSPLAQSYDPYSAVVAPASAVASTAAAAPTSGLGGLFGYSSAPAPQAAAAAGAFNPTGKSLTETLAYLDSLSKGRYDKPSAEAAISGLGTLDGISGLQFVTNSGKGAKVKVNESGFVPLIEGAQYRIWNEKGDNKLLYTGEGAEGLQQVYNIAQNLSATKGKKANWGVEMLDPATQQWVRVADDDPASGPKIMNIIGDVFMGALGFVALGPLGAALGVAAHETGVDKVLMKYGLPIALALTPLGPIAGAALGSSIGTAYTGGNLKEILMSAGLSAATAGALKFSGLDKVLGNVMQEIPGVSEAVGSLSGVANNAFDTVFSQQIANGASQAVATQIAQEATDEIIVTGMRDILAAAAGTAGGIVNGMASGALDFSSEVFNNLNQSLEDLNALKDDFDQTFPGNEGATAGTENAAANGTQNTITATNGGTTGIPGVADPNQIVVSATSQAKINAAAQAILSGATAAHPALQGLTDAEFQAAQQQAAQGTDGGSITVTGNTGTTTAGTGSAAGIGGTATGGGPQPDVNDTGTEMTVHGPGTTNAGTGGVAGIGGTVTGGGSSDQFTNSETGENQIVVPGNPPGGPGDLGGSIGNGVDFTDSGDLTDTGLDTGDGTDTGTEDGNGGGLWRYVKLLPLIPTLINGVGGLLGAGQDNTQLTPDTTSLTYSPLTRTQNNYGGGAGGTSAPAFDVFTYGQDIPGAQRGEYEFFQPYSLRAAPQTGSATTTSPIYTQADVDAANARTTATYNANAALFDAYQNNLATQVSSGSMTPEAATTAAQQYATSLGLTVNAPAATTAATPAATSVNTGTTMKDGGEVEDDMVKHLVEYHRNGGHSGPGQVKGIGSGQEDKIPAWLSDGEYVWSAQDVADLGDGSTDEGVRRLDRMRQMVRRQAGRKDVKKIAKPQRGIEIMLRAVGGRV